MYKKMFLFFIFSFLLIGCSSLYNPATGKKELYFIDTNQEVAIGKSVNEEVLKKYKVLDDPKTKSYIARIGERVAGVSDRQDLEYDFVVLDDKELNAFTVPGGTVYVNKGLIDIMSEDELAAVLGHEIGHVSARHAVKRIQSQLGYQVLLTIAAVGVAQKDAQMAKTVAQSSNTIFQLVQLGYSRKDELLADKLAIKYSRKAGYDPMGMVNSLKKLQAQSEKTGTLRAPVVLQSHPYIEDRITAGMAEVGVLTENEEKL